MCERGYEGKRKKKKKRKLGGKEGFISYRITLASDLGFGTLVLE
jgi:hypothetical protein